MKQAKESFLSTTNLSFIEEQLQIYLQDHNAVSLDWQQYFGGLNLIDSDKINYLQQEKLLQQIMSQPSLLNNKSSATLQHDNQEHNIISEFRLNGHLYANLDLLKINNQHQVQNHLYQYLQTSSPTIDKYKKIYCQNIGFECSYISNINEKSWLEEKIENDYLKFKLSPPEYLQAFKKILAAEQLEQFLHNNYVGAKRFSLEGCDSFIPMLDYLINQAGQHGVTQLVLGMAHRGRLNTLVNILGKPSQDLCDEFTGKAKQKNNGDVKYHKGGSALYNTNYGDIKIDMLNNPSHLEAVNPVVQGFARALQDQTNNKTQILPLLVHGDAAFIGLGVNQGCFNMSQTNAYSIMGSIHIILNNQIGFTNSNPKDSRSSYYCTDIAKMIQAPIIHVNAEDINSIAFVTKLAVEYRQKFNKDIIIDLIGYRKYGHNEADDPSLTQPFMYAHIKKYVGIYKKLEAELLESEIITNQEITTLKNNYVDSLKSGQSINNNIKWQDLRWQQIKPSTFNLEHDQQLLQQLHDKISNLKLPENFVLHPTIVKLLATRKQMVAKQQPVNLALAETLAYALLLNYGINIRVSGEDSKRGTFSHRMAVLHNYKTQNNDDDNNSSITPLNLINTDAQFMIYDSILNEEAVLSFEYGYSLQAINNLVVWEAQFGDFANGAQVAIDQFITSAYNKWGDKSRLLIILPHGLDGQGPEHSSARIERFLQLSAQDNIKLFYPSNAAQLFHLVLDQMRDTSRIKPAVLFLSKKLLRSKDAAVDLDLIINQKQYQKIINDNFTDNKKITKIICCCGQIYYDLLKQQQNQSQITTAIIRIEQLYPLPVQELKSIIATYPNASNFIWVQEEHYNQGAWAGIRDLLADCANFTCIARPAYATTACGSIEVSNQQLTELLNKALS